MIVLLRGLKSQVNSFEASRIHSSYTTSPNRMAHKYAMPTEKAYPSSKVPINEEKLRDITKSIKYIPEENQGFYRGILSWSKA